MKTLRLLVAVELGLMVASTVLELLLEPYLPEPLRTYVGQIGDEAITALDLVLGLVAFGTFAFMVVASVAVWRMSRGARELFALSRGLAVVVTALLGPYVHAGPAVALETAAPLVAGIILGILYFGQRPEELRARVKTP